MTKAEALDSLRDVMRRRHYAYSTLQNYSFWTGRFFDWVKAHPSTGTEPAARMEGFLTDLAKGDCSAATQNQAFNAILFFYRQVVGKDPGEVKAMRARRPKMVRHAPTRAQVEAVLSSVEDSPSYPYRLILGLIYGCGLRVSEPLALRLRDIDLEKGRLVIRQGKGAKDRVVTIPPVLRGPIAEQMRMARKTHARAVDAGVPAKLPNRLSRKYRNAGLEAGWFWLFPAVGPCDDPAHPGERVWWHCLPESVQKAMRKASKKAGLGGVLTPHHLRHAWATHAADAGASLRDLQEILGHKSLETTMQYVHPHAERVVSPLESLAVSFA